jgi:hypothetical protein
MMPNRIDFAKWLLWGGVCLAALGLGALAVYILL